MLHTAPSPFPLSPRIAYALAGICGLVSLLAFPGADAWPLAFVSFVPLVVALHKQPAARGFRLGWTAAFVGKLGAFYWIVPLLRKFGALPLPACALALVLLCAYQAGRFGLHGWLACRLAARGWSAWLAFGAAFIVSEQVFPLLFPWSFGASLHDVPHLLQTAELGGPIAVGLVLLCSNLALSEGIVARLERRPVRWRLAVTLAAVPIVAALYGHVRMAQIDGRVAQAPGARIGIVQANMGPGEKEHDPFEGLGRHTALTRRLQNQGPLDLVIWSEAALALPLWEQDLSGWVTKNFAARLGVPLLFGAVVTRSVPDPRRYVVFNSALLTNASGQVEDRYDKHHLMPFSELLPLGNRLPWLYKWLPHGARGEAGSADRPVRFGQHELATLICYEDILPAFANAVVRNGHPDLLVDLTNDAWFGDTTEPWIHLALSRMRAVEHRRFFVRVANSGISALIDPAGRLVERTPVFAQDARVLDVRWMKGRTPYELWGDAPWWLLSAAAFIAAWPHGSARRRRWEPAAPRAI